jgi:hypothetical protein
MACGSKHKYGNGGQVKVHFADGGQVKKNPLPKPKSPFPPKKVETAAPPGGNQTPGAKAKRKKG